MAKLFVICGHGAGDPGACGNGFSEAERVRVLGKRIAQLGGSSVMLGDVNRNYYADKGINSLSISKDYQILEFHMDSADASAKGAHVIIKSGFSPDEYDNKLASFLSGLFPGRSNIIVGRSDLANVNRAAARGYGYRLAECGFISNAGDVQIFNANIDYMAKGILECFGISVNGGSSTPTTPTTPSTSTGSSSDKISEDGYWGRNTTTKAQKVFKTTVDGVVSNQWAMYKSKNPGLDSGWDWHTRPNGTGSQLIRAIQRWCGMPESKIDGEAGPETFTAMQRKLGCAIVDGYVSGPSNMVKAFQRYLNSK